MKIKSARITKMPKKMGDKMPEVYVILTNGKEEFLFTYYPDEISFTEKEFIGLTIDEARHLKFIKDKAYLTKEDDYYNNLGKVVFRSGGKAKNKNWIQDTIQYKGALKRTAVRKGLIDTKDEKLSMSDLKKLEKIGGKTAQRSRLAQTLRNFDNGGDLKANDLSLGVWLKNKKTGTMAKIWNIDPSLGRMQLEDIYGNKDNMWRTAKEWKVISTPKKLENGGLVGKRVKLIFMHDPHPVEPYTEGTIDHVDGIGQLHVKWDNGRTLAIIPEIDQFEIIENMGGGGSTREMRPSPTDSATMYPQGFRKRGNDGNIWEIALTSAGIHRWVKSKSSSPSSEQEPTPKPNKTLYDIVYDHLKKYPTLDFDLVQLSQWLKAKDILIDIELKKLLDEKKIEYYIDHKGNPEASRPKHTLVYKYLDAEKEKSLHELMYEKIKAEKEMQYINLSDYFRKMGYEQGDIDFALNLLRKKDRVMQNVKDKRTYYTVNEGEKTLDRLILEYLQKDGHKVSFITLRKVFNEELGFTLIKVREAVARLVRAKEISEEEIGNITWHRALSDESNSKEDTSEKGKLIKKLNELRLDNFVVSVAFITNKDMGELHHKAQSEEGRKQITDEVADFILKSKNKDVYLAELKRYKKGGRITFGDTVHVPSVNKTGMVYEITGDKVTVRFINGIEEYKRDEVEKVKTFKTGGNQKGWEYTIGGL